MGGSPELPKGMRRAVVASSLCLAIAACGVPGGEPNAEPPGTTTMSSPTPSRTPSATSTPSTSTTPSASSTPSATTSPSATGTAKAATCQVPARLAGQDLSTLPIPDRAIALTFDGGSNAAGVRSILGTLAAYDVPATFFLTGSFVRSFPVKSSRIAREHLVGNHTGTHPDLTHLSDAAVTREVRNAEASIRAVTGEDPRRFFRFPFGARSPHLVTLLNRLCYVPFRWTVDTLGWMGTSTGKSVTTVTNRVLAGARPGAIVLMHVGAHPDDGSTLDADAMPVIIRKLRRAGYQFVDLSRILGEAP